MGLAENHSFGVCFQTLTLTLQTLLGLREFVHGLLCAEQFDLCLQGIEAALRSSKIICVRRTAGYGLALPVRLLVFKFCAACLKFSQTAINCIEARTKLGLDVVDPATTEWRQTLIQVVQFCSPCADRCFV